MSDTFNSFLVVMEGDVCEEYANEMKRWFMSIRGVAGVTPVKSDAFAEYVAEVRVKQEIGAKLQSLLLDMWESSERPER